MSYRQVKRQILLHLCYYVTVPGVLCLFVKGRVRELGAVKASRKSQYINELSKIRQLAMGLSAANNAQEN